MQRLEYRVLLKDRVLDRKQRERKGGLFVILSCNKIIVTLKTNGIMIPWMRLFTEGFGYEHNKN